ncbi:MAG: filamentous hemagglutinin N-terminal domain-containing protein, partial [Gammaproteobacteria bacterium]
MARTYRGAEFRYGLAQRLALTLLVLPLSVTTEAEITVDGSLGSFRGSLAGPAFQIDADLGKQIGTNLFHSFGAFNINHPESASFTPNGSTGPIANVLNRVTGDSASTIDGTLRSTIPDANLFFFNPHGVAFGPHAQLDVPGSFHVSTADYLRLGDGVRFEAQPSANDALLTTAPPEAFGFLSEQPAGISVQGSAIELREGNTLSLIGGDFDYVGGDLDSQGQPTSFLSAPSGRINLASVASSGEASLGTTGLGTHAFTQLGQITLSNNGFIATDGPGGGRIFVRGGRLVADSAFISANTLGDRDGQGIDIDIAGELRLDNRSFIQAVTFIGGGDAGDISLRAGSVEVRAASQIVTFTLGAGDSGNASIQAGSILVSGAGITQSSSSAIVAAADHGSSGDAGNLTLRADILEVRSGVEIGVASFGSGRAGNLLVEAGRILLSRDGSRFFTGFNSAATRGSGTVTVRARDLQIHGGAVITSATSGPGDGGHLLVEAERVLLSGDDGARDGTLTPSEIFATAKEGSTGSAGDVTVRANHLELRNGALITASTRGSGRGGNIMIYASEVNLHDRGEILAISTGSGVSGNIFINALNKLRLVNESQIRVDTTSANAGDINLNVGALLHLRDNSAITTSVAGGQGDGGNITIDPTFLVLDDSSIVANAVRGRGGNVRIVADHLFRTPDSLIEASSELGIQGTVEIRSPDTDVSTGLLALPANFFGVATVLMKPCAERSAADEIRLVVRKYEVLPDSPYA